MDIELKKAKADIVIDNSGSLQDTEQQVDRFWKDRVFKKSMKSRRKLTVAAALTCLTVFVVWLFTDVDGIARFLYPVSYEKDILLSSREHDVDPLLVAAIIRVESNFSPERVSAKKAAGLMQIMPQTAEWIVERGGYAPEAVEQLHQPDVAIELGVWYLREFETAICASIEGDGDKRRRFLAGGCIQRRPRYSSQMAERSCMGRTL